MRAFLGFEIPFEVSTLLDSVEDALAAVLPHARWVPTANRHLTLVFLGNATPEQLSGLDSALRPLFAATDSLNIEAVRCGTFPPGRPGRVAWVGFRPSSELLSLQRSVEDICLRSGFGAERRQYRPHVTMARCKRPWSPSACDTWRREGSARIDRATTARMFAARRGCLFESVPVARGVRYQIDRSFPFAVRKGPRSAVSAPSA